VGRKVLVVGLGAVAIAAIGLWLYERPRTYEVSFRDLEVTSPVDYSPGAPEGFPDCTIDMLDARIEDTRARVDVTFRPEPGVQCGFPVYVEAWWIDGTGERFEGKSIPTRMAGKRRLLHGANGVSDAGGIESACGMRAPYTYYLMIAGEALEIGSIEKQLGCYRTRMPIYPSYMLYRSHGLETPAGSLDGAISDLAVDGDRIRFTWTMTNDTDDDIEISRCPLVDLELQDAGVEREGHGYRTYLNCLDAPDVVEPGDALRFEIEAPMDELGTGPLLEVELRDETRTIYRVTEEAPG
jgi:hypothetical protein